MLVLAMEFSRDERAETTPSEEAPRRIHEEHCGAEQSLPQNGIVMTDESRLG